ncbi:hypothetical protein H8356DRAFT_1653640 [Neocallimastix lanati (nom. inval.)]|jgi:hypothetical protein|uniref:CBM10 domain-containing protein n=1 Tax=Neocallimastix californiae TaxID=1754190 RepID=A0A1Y1ZST8_9FUNG|nr:hypothetical protein H8356DRAFT_1653640 [Neocallimastix sp. JGI-2020a]ORY13323.1 hypothetical protein LY90DRAFT_677706 [Neocallimastix californiae]|eukprot:ORY13323.1 hypothetical protein LY90DRAFT_677706 [Neocallimastix californiae]
MKLIPILSSLLFIGSEYVQALSNCSTCRAVTVEDGISWGVENNDWCIVPASCFNDGREQSKCLSIPGYTCCEGCKVSEIDGDGISWGIENGEWCIVPLSCNESSNKENQCFSYPEYSCCKSCTVIAEDDNGQWGIEDDEWCGIRDSCSAHRDLDIDFDGEPDFYVSVDGSDSNDGSKDSPFATLDKARQAVRGLSKTKNIVVEIADGFYPVDKTIKFTSEDSGNNKSTIYYKSAKGAHPIISGGEKITGSWTRATEVNWLRNGLTAYKTPLKRNKKLRAIYVNGDRADMTKKVIRPSGKSGNYSVRKGQASWAWNSRNGMADAVIFPSNAGLSANTRNPQNIELDSSSTWARQIVCVESLSSSNGVVAKLQMPYGAFAQNLGWGTAYSPTSDNTVSNVFEWLNNPGEFYFDQAGSMLYYIPRQGENINNLEVVVPKLDTIIEMRGNTPLKSYVQNIVFNGITFAYSDWNLYELNDGGKLSHGYASVQGAIVMSAFGQEDQHNDIYRTYDVPVSAIYINSSRNVKFLNGEIRHTGSIGMHLENDVNDIEVTGNYIAKTSGAGIVIGHPTHVYENDNNRHSVGSNFAGPDKEKFKNGTESVPKNISVTNNYLLENCYSFSGHSPITSFYTYNLQVLHNFVYKCSYSGMSIGWGWCEFDGFDGRSLYDMNANQFDGYSKGPARIVGVPTETSKNNHINYNRVEEICSLLSDAGGIYTLGKQGNQDWTEYSEMSYNYINCKRNGQQADGSRRVNGFHPDEGSAYIKFDGNVVTNIVNNVYELNNWRRKHDMTITNSFSNTDRSETTAPKCSLDQYVNGEYIWPLKGYETVLYSGLEDKYVYMVSKDVMPDTYYELASNVRLSAGDELPRRGLLKPEDTVWLAPKGTRSFTAGNNMTKSAGNEKSMKVPTTPGEYKMFIKYANGSVSDASRFTLYVGKVNKAANVADGKDYMVSKKRPLKLELDTSYSFKLNGRNVSNGYTIDSSGRWTLQASKGNGDSFSALFTTTVTEANRVLTKDVTVGSGGTIKFDEVISDKSKLIWIASNSLTAFDENDPAITMAYGGSTSMKAPSVAGTYVLTITDAFKKILSTSDAVVIVK